MSAPAPPPLTQAAADFESDSESLGTPVDPPTAVQPHVAGYGPLGEYYYAGAAAYDNTEYAVGHPELHYRYSDPGFVGAAAQQGLLLGPAYVEAGLPEDCSRNNSIMSSYRWSGSGRGATHGQGDLLGGCAQEGIPDSSSTGSSPSLAPAIHRDELRSQYTATSLQYADCDREHATFGENIQNISSYALARSRQPGLVCDTNVGYPLSGSQRLHSSPDQNVLPAAAIFPQSYYDEGYVESSIDDSLHCDAFANSGCKLEPSSGFDGQPQPAQPHLDTHLSSGLLQPRHSVRFYQPPSCPYTYPHVDGPLDVSGYSADPLAGVPGLYHPRSIIHAPRPQQVHDLHNLHDSTCGARDVPAARVLSIPSGPMQPIPRPSSLIEDSPKKPLTLACYFCRKRKIACQSPPANSVDRTCNQCAKRKLKCVYPATSRRGIRPRVYDLQDDRIGLPRSSGPLSL